VPAAVRHTHTSVIEQQVGLNWLQQLQEGQTHRGVVRQGRGERYSAFDRFQSGGKA
jgi:hypothetical protein